MIENTNEKYYIRRYWEEGEYEILQQDMLLKAITNHNEKCKNLRNVLKEKALLSVEKNEPIPTSLGYSLPSFITKIQEMKEQIQRL